MPINCDRHNLHIDAPTDICPACHAEQQVAPVVTGTAVTHTQQQIEVNLPLAAGGIVDEQVRQVVYQGIRSEIQAFITKWGFTDYNIQLKWPDTDNHPTIEFFSAGMKYYHRFLGSMIDKCGTLRPSTKLRFIQALVAGLDRLGYFQELQTIMNSYQFQREQNHGLRTGNGEEEENLD